MVEPPSDSDAALLLDMWLAARDVHTFLEGLDRAAFLASRLHQNAVIRSLEVIGEAAGKVSPATRAGADRPADQHTRAAHPGRGCTQGMKPIISVDETTGLAVAA